MLLRTLAEFAKVGEVGISKLVWFERERERERSEINVLGMPLFIYLFYSWFYFVWGVLCAEGIRRDELLIVLIQIIRWCFSLFELPTTVRMLPRQYLFQSWWNFRSHQTQLSIPASLCTESMVLHNIFQDFSPLHCAFAAGNRTACSLCATESRNRENSPF